jgi:hypothetical protein
LDLDVSGNRSQFVIGPLPLLQAEHEILGEAFEPVFNLSSFLTRIRRGGSGAPAHPPTRRAASGSPYEGTTAGRRLGTWVTTRDAINSVWYQSADQLVARSRDIIRKDGWASKAVDDWVCNAIGTGIKPQSMLPTLAVIAVVRPPETPEWAGVLDRLRRAAR